MSAESSEAEAATGLWGQLPSFDPSTGRSHSCIFSESSFSAWCLPSKPNLAPRLAMLCKGTAWSQVRNLDPKKLVEPDAGVSYLLDALSGWEETSDLKTFELFEKALYKVTQKADEATHVLRLQAAFDDLAERVTLKKMQAFILLRQSRLSSKDKKRILSMTNGELKTKGIEQAMRKVSTEVLFSAGDVKKKI